MKRRAKSFAPRPSLGAGDDCSENSEVRCDKCKEVIVNMPRGLAGSVKARHSKCLSLRDDRRGGAPAPRMSESYLGHSIGTISRQKESTLPSMQELTEEEKKAVRLYMAGMSYVEIARELGCNECKVGSLLASARQKRGKQEIPIRSLAKGNPGELLPAERRLVAFMQQGLTANRELASELGWSVGSVATIKRRIRRKLQG